MSGEDGKKSSRFLQWIGSNCASDAMLPPGFTHDGCTMSPDGPWLRCCNWHDWQYRKARELGRLGGFGMKIRADLGLWGCMWKTWRGLAWWRRVVWAWAPPTYVAALLTLGVVWWFWIGGRVRDE